MKKRIASALLAGLMLVNIASCSRSSQNSGGRSNSGSGQRTDKTTEDSTTTENNTSSDTLRYKAASVSDFKSAVYELYGDDIIENDVTGKLWLCTFEKDNYKNPCERVYFTNKGHDFEFNIYVYDNAAYAKEQFEGFYNYKIDIVEAQGYEGTSKYAYSGNEGYILFNGHQRDLYGEPYAYGGIYLKDNTIVYVDTIEDRTSLRNDVDKFLKTIGYPLPSDYL